MKCLVTCTIIFCVAFLASGAPGVTARSADDAQAAPQRTQPPSSDGKLNIIAFGAHPDDCDQRAGGTAAKYAALGHRVRFVSVTNGDAGHQTEGGGALAARRRAEAQEAGRRIGIEYVVLDNHDGELLPTLHVREQIIRQIRQWKADLVLAPRPNDYHPDHRYTGVLLQDAAARKRWLRETRAGQPAPAVRATLTKWYGPEKGNAVRYAEAFEICEYGTRPDEAMIRKLFPFLPNP